MKKLLIIYISTLIAATLYLPCNWVGHGVNIHGYDFLLVSIRQYSPQIMNGGTYFPVVNGIEIRTVLTRSINLAELSIEYLLITLFFSLFYVLFFYHYYKKE